MLAFWKKNRLRAGRGPAGVLEALLAAEPYPVGGKISSGLLWHGVQEARHRRSYATSAFVRGPGTWNNIPSRSTVATTNFS